jgi:hypothetical protein
MLNLGGGNFKTQFRRADRSGARLAVILGDEELDRGVAAVKPLRHEGGQIDCPVELLPARTALRHGALAERIIRVEEYLDDREQWERVLAGLREQGPWLLADRCGRRPRRMGGWRYWQTRTEQRALDAAARYQQVLEAFSHNDLSWRPEDR